MAKKKIEKTKEKDIEKAQVPIKWNVPNELNSIYASNMLVQLLENEFKILFFETKPSPRTTPDEPKEKEVRADCVASIIVHPLKIAAFIEVLQRQFRSYLSREGLQIDEETRKIIPIEP